jgi:hypothetical protein
MQTYSIKTKDGKIATIKGNRQYTTPTHAIIMQGNKVVHTVLMADLVFFRMG